MNFLRNALVLVSVSALSLTAMAKDVKQVKLAKASPNCEVKNKKIHVKNEDACVHNKKGPGKWLEASAAPTPAAVTPPPAAGPAAAPVDAAPAAATAPDAPKK